MSGREASDGRANQRLRTRKDLLDAAARLVQRGGKPTLEEVAAEALVSRATAYRYFPSPEALMLEAAVHIGVPGPAEVFGDFPNRDPAARLLRVEEALHEAILANEAPLRLMLAHTLEQSVARGASELPARQNRRSGLIDAALEPAGGAFTPLARETLGHAVAMLVGIEAMVVAKDVLQIDDATAHHVKQWAISALVEAARSESPATSQPAAAAPG